MSNRHEEMEEEEEEESHTHREPHVEMVIINRNRMVPLSPFDWISLWVDFTAD